VKLSRQPLRQARFPNTDGPLYNNIPGPFHPVINLPQDPKIV
jgi:hypothetical protein